MEDVVGGNLFFIVIDPFPQGPWIAEKKNCAGWKIVEQGGERGALGFGSLVVAILGESFQDAEFAGWWKRHLLDCLPRNLADRIEIAKRFQFLAKKLQPHRPWTGQWVKVENTAAQSDLALLRHLGFRFIALVLQPFHEIERVIGVAASQRPRARLQTAASECGLEQSRDGRDDDGGRDPRARRVATERNQRLEAFADDIRVRQFVFVRQDFPSGIEQSRRFGIHLCAGGRGQPGFHILVHAFLRFHALRDQNDGAVREEAAEQNCQERMGRRGHRCTRQNASLLHALSEGLNSGS